MKLNLKIFLLCISTIILGFFNNNAIANEKIIKVGYVPNFGTIIDSVSNEISGYGYEYLEKIAEYAGFKYEYIPCTWEQGQQMLLDGKIDVFGPISKTQERESIFEYSKMPFGYQHILLAVSEDSDILFNQYEQLDGMTISVLENSIYPELVQKFADENQITLNMLMTNGNNEDLRLKNGEVDVTAVSSFVNLEGSKIIGKIAETDIFYITTSKYIMNKIDAAMQSIKDDYYWYETNLYQKYYSDKNAAQINLTKIESLLIQNSPVIKVGYDAHSAPFQYNNSKNEADGISIRLMNEISRITGLQFEYVEIDHNLKQYQDIDIVLPYSKCFEDIIGSMSSTKPYLEVPIIVVGPYTNTNAKTKTAGYVEFEGFDLSYFTSHFVGFEIKKYLHIDDMVKAVENGEIEYSINSLYTMEEIIKLGNVTGFETYKTQELLPL